MEAGNILAISSAWMATLGRTHVLIVHFPIPLLIVGGLIECWRVLRGKPGLSPAGVTCIILGALSAAIACAAGWIHSGFQSFGAESQTTLWLHQWIGIVTASVALLTILPLIFHRETRWLPKRLYRIGAVLGAIGVAVAGHFGGTLTHGSGYLTELLFAGRRIASRNARGSGVG